MNIKKINMNPKEKAYELFDQFYSITEDISRSNYFAMIVCSEVIKQLSKRDYASILHIEDKGYWADVLIELDKM